MFQHYFLYACFCMCTHTHACTHNVKHRKLTLFIVNSSFMLIANFILLSNIQIKSIIQLSLSQKLTHMCQHTHVRVYTHHTHTTHTHTHYTHTHTTHTHTLHTHTTHTQSKAKLTAAVTQLLPPSDNTGMPDTTLTLKPSAANPPGLRLVTSRRTVQVSQIEVAEPKAPHCLTRDRQLSICLRQVPIDVTAGWAAPPGIPI